jgi:hypothetical protein
MQESVIYAPSSGERVLREWRDCYGIMQDCILDGEVEICDSVQDDYVLAAAWREAEEEPGVQVRQCKKVGEFE